MNPMYSGANQTKVYDNQQFVGVLDIDNILGLLC